MVILLTLKSFIFLNDPSNSLKVEVEASCQNRLKAMPFGTRRLDGI